MTISPATVTALALVCFIGTMSAAAQAAPPRKNAVHSTYHKKPVRNGPQAATPRGPSDADRWMNRASEPSNSGGGGGGGY